MSEETKIQPRQWWEKLCVRVFVVGSKYDGSVIVHHEYGRIVTLAKDELVMDGWKHLPECTGWDWQPPAESPDDWVTQNRVHMRPHIDETRWVSCDPCNTWTGDWKVYNGLGIAYRHNDTKINDKYYKIEVRCRRKDLPPMPQQPSAPEPAKTRTVTLQEWVCIHGEEIILRWQAGKPEGWEHEYPTGNTRTIEVPCE